MLNVISQALENFCIHQIRIPYTLNEGIIDKRTLIAYIDIEMQEDDKTHRVYLAAVPAFAQRVSTIFLEEDESDEETLMDMMLETANLVVGSAKVIAEESGKNPFVIKTPHFEKIDLFDFPYDLAKVIKIEDDEMIIAIKELN